MVSRPPRAGCPSFVPRSGHRRYATTVADGACSNFWDGEVRRMMIDHFGLGVSDYTRSKAFYAAALAPLGMALVMEVGPEQSAG